jgi:hypothetical protein
MPVDHDRTNCGWWLAAKSPAKSNRIGQLQTGADTATDQTGKCEPQEQKPPRTEEQAVYDGRGNDGEDRRIRGREGRVASRQHDDGGRSETCRRDNEEAMLSIS